MIAPRSATVESVATAEPYSPICAKEDVMTPAISDLTARFSGQLLQPTDAGYDEARRVHNGLIDKRPGLIARCLNVADIVDAVNLAHDGGLEVAVKGGGHNVAGRATIGSNFRWRPMSAESSAADPYRRVLSFSRAFAAIVSISPR